MPINLQPYNYWILYAACIALLVCFIILGMKAVHLLKTVNTLKPTMDNMQKNATLAQIKAEAMQEKKAEEAEKNKKLKFLIPFLLAIKHSYDTSDKSLSHTKRIGNAAKAASTQMQQKQVFDYFKHMM